MTSIDLARGPERLKYSGTVFDAVKAGAASLVLTDSLCAVIDRRRNALM